MHGQHQQPCARQPFAEQFDGIQPAEFRHVDIHHHHIGIFCFGQSQDRMGRAHGTHHPDMVEGFHHRADALKHQRMVVADQHFDGAVGHAGTGSGLLVT
ncbi:hypothetical protein D3C72_2076460 [compost metagenome]